MKQKINIVCIGIAVLFVFDTSRSSAQTREDWRAAEDSTDGETQASRPTEYKGVHPGSGNHLPKIEELKNRTGIWVTWPGFTMTDDGGSMLFLQTTNALNYKLKQKGASFLVEISNAAVYLGNNRNPLVTTHFNTPLKRAYLKRHRKGLWLVMDMKTTVQPQLSQSTNPDGYSYLLIVFPPYVDNDSVK